MTSSGTHNALRYLRNAGIDAAYLVVGLPLGILTFTVIVTGASLGAGLLITLVGIPVLLVTLLLARWLGVVERQRAALVLGEPIAPGERPLEGGGWQRVKTIATDPSSWLASLWSLLLLPIGIAGFSIAVSAWSAVLGLISSPLWYWALPDDENDIRLFDDPALGYSVLRVLIGLALIPVAYWLCRGLSLGTAQLARLLLGEREQHSPSMPTTAAQV